MDSYVLHWLLTISVGGFGLGVGLFMLAFLVFLSYVASPYYPFLRFFLKRYYRRALSRA